MEKLVHHHLYFPTTYTDEGLVGKLGSSFPTTYTDDGLVGKVPGCY